MNVADAAKIALARNQDGVAEREALIVIVETASVVIGVNAPCGALGDEYGRLDF